MQERSSTTTDVTEKDGAPNGKKPRLTVVTVCRNDRENLEKTLVSLLDEGSEGIELVVVDGASTDDTVEFLERFSARFTGKMRWISEPDSGVYDAMNKGIGLATGSMVVFLNAGDSYQEGVLELLLSHASEKRIFYGSTRLVDSCGNEVAISRPRPEVLNQEFPNALIASHQSLAFPAEFLESVGGFDLRWPISADYNLFCECKERGFPFAYLEGFTSNFLLGGISDANPDATAREYRDIKMARGCSRLIANAVYAKNRLALMLFRHKKAKV